MRGLTGRFLARRLVAFVFTVWIGATLIFFIPRMVPGDPIASRIAQRARSGRQVANPAEMIEAWRERFGLNEPLLVQYGEYLVKLPQFDLGYSLRFYPAHVDDMILDALPWTVGLLLTATLLAFLVGNAIGALLAWPGTPRPVRAVLPLTLPFTAIPHFMIGIVLLFTFAFTYSVFPPSGMHARGVTPGFTLEFVTSLIHYGTLPVLSIVLAQLGFYALAMRGMMISTAGEDYMTLGEAKGLRPRRLFWKYGIRNAMLPQLTDLTLSIGGIVGGAVLVEIIFAYRGIGFLLLRAIEANDFTLINGIVFTMILTTAFFVLIVDLVYPLLDPRISYAGGVE